MTAWMRQASTKSRRFDDYQIVKIIHDGEKAAVYQGRDPEDESLVAIKAYKPLYNRTARRLRKRYHLRNEGEIGMLVNPKTDEDAPDWPIVRTLDHGYEFGDGSKCYYIIQEYVDGINAKHLLGCEDPLIREKRLDVAIAVARGLCHIHSRGLIHRDVCMDNVMLSRAGRVTLIDLGFVTPTGIAFREKSGTPSYMAPEQFQALPLQPTTDVYSFGVLLFELFTGRLPFRSGLSTHNQEVAHRRAAELSEMHLNAPPPIPSDFVSDLPPRIEPLILRCMAKKPHERYPNMRAVLSMLQLVKGEES
jgi:eukaryotic-like serine/threonine-protein kinase